MCSEAERTEVDGDVLGQRLIPDGALRLWLHAPYAGSFVPWGVCSAAERTGVDGDAAGQGMISDGALRLRLQALNAGSLDL